MNLTPHKSLTLDLRTPTAQELWRTIVSAGNPFTRALTSPRTDPSSVETWREAFQAEGIALFEEQKEPVLPIETFKWFPDLMPIHDAVRAFRSSGTTMRERSVSKFTHDGYELYRGVSLFTFYSVLKRFFSTPGSVRGFSLVPLVKDWPESSLAQMVEWIGQVSPVTYLDANNMMQLQNQKEPIWVFGTGFHFVELFDQGMNFPLPPGSLVIETGGTKGKTREVTREEYLHILEKGFAIHPWQILSEYGMSELASQAYEWLDPGQHHNERVMRFPWWVNVQATNAQGAVQTEGFGALCIFDGARTDVPLPLRTQDLVELKRDGSFALKGRVPVAALKGCSLNAESFIEARSVDAKKSGYHQRKKISLQPAVARLKHAGEKLLALLEEVEFRSLAIRELGNETLFEGFKADLLAGLKDCQRNPESALRKALDPEGKSYEKWLFILSATHPQAAFYPCVLTYALGLKMWLRPTGSSQSIEGQFFKFLSDLPDAEITVLPPSFRIGVDAIPDVEAIFCFGSDETVNSLQEMSGLPVAGYGSHLTVSQITDFSKESLALAAKDCLSLSQKGCMSTRLLVCKKSYSDAEADNFMEKLQEASAPWVRNLSPAMKEISLDHEWVEARLRKKALRVKPGTPLIYAFDERRLEVSLADLFSQRNLVIPVVFVAPERSSAFMQRLKQEIPDFSLQTGIQAEKIRGVETRPLGQANRPPWDGLLQGRSLLETRTTLQTGAL